MMAVRKLWVLSFCLMFGVVAARADMYPDASNAKLPAARINLGINPMVDDKTGAIAITGATFEAVTAPGTTADQILAWVFCTSACLPLPAQGGGNYDAVRGIGISNPGTTTPIVAGVSGYVLANQPFVSHGPSSVALFGTGAVNVDSGSVWGANTNVSDREYRVAQPAGTHNRRVVGAEFDVSASYIDTSVTGVLVGGNSVVQPSNSRAVVVVGQDFSASTPGAIAKWDSAYVTGNGIATHFAFIGTAGPPTGTTNSQDFQFTTLVGGTPSLGHLTFGTGFLGQSATNPSFSFDYPIGTLTGGAAFRSSANEVVQLAGNVDLPSGVSIMSRNDAGSALQPLELAAQYIYVNGPLLLKTSTVAALAVCVPGIANSFAAVSDAVAPTYNGVLSSGGGSVHVPVFCDGGTWRTH